MDVNDLARHPPAKSIRQNLHVASKHDQLGFGLFDNFDKLSLCLRLVFPGYLYVVEGYVVIDDHLLVVEVVGDDPPRRRLAERRSSNGRADRSDNGRSEIPSAGPSSGFRRQTAPPSFKFIRDRLEALLQLRRQETFFRNEADSHEEFAGVEVVELRAVNNGSLDLKEKSKSQL